MTDDKKPETTPPTTSPVAAANTRAVDAAKRDPEVTFHEVSPEVTHARTKDGALGTITKQEGLEPTLMPVAYNFITLRQLREVVEFMEKKELMEKGAR